MENKRKKVCILTSVHNVFDTRIFHKECKSLANSGMDVTLIAQHNRSEIVDGIKIIALPKVRNRFGRVTIVAWNLFIEALRQKADIYHFHDPELSFLCVLLRKLLKTKVIYDVHEDYYTSILLKKWIPNAFARRLTARLFDFLEKQIIVPKFDAVILAEKYYEDRFSSIKQKCYTILNYPIRKTPKYKNKLIDIKVHDSKTFNIIYSGGITEDRGALNVVKGFIECTKHSENLELYLIGYLSSENLYRKIVRLLTSNNLLKRVKIEGKGKFVSREIIDSYYKYMNLGISLVSPDLHYERKLLTKFFEYMKNGLPILISNFSLWKDFVKENRCGLTVNPLDPKAISDAIKYLIEYEEEAQEMGEKGRKAVLEKYNWENEENKLLAIYEQLLNTNKQ